MFEKILRTSWNLIFFFGFPNLFTNFKCLAMSFSVIRSCYLLLYLIHQITLYLIQSRLTINCISVIISLHMFVHIQIFHTWCPNIDGTPMELLTLMEHTRGNFKRENVSEKCRVIFSHLKPHFQESRVWTYLVKNWTDTDAW